MLSALILLVICESKILAFSNVRKFGTINC